MVSWKGGNSGAWSELSGDFDGEKAATTRTGRGRAGAYRRSVAGGVPREHPKHKKLTLREVGEATGKEVSNAYLSQLETGKITRPSPNVLHALAMVYGVPYETLMQKAGYISPASPGGAGVLRSASPARLDRIAAFGDESLTLEEQEKLLEYLAFLRSRKGTRGKG
jgi:HTH-type transcriptional regulator, competence development regulator